ncbi:hypothetical protein CC1G_14313 [Coprinopsis cinerea okayama7|uniref:Uncharacterized protein n=1 Tax=Coprinopsis cinerea (strain Okayama-7 / 130 / ATCC MYA-4618 / FGSC 9003) TaxID=240176 RepID=D6RLX0_COPC7|nr:hypothetical protein CC1G_14313 [Coprinopsis cinerea okayama7\|eukprot:XP_002911318.1 hypothetical protein CC1G_14313 [Coprinopsis cinerea okayama7\
MPKGLPGPWRKSVYHRAAGCLSVTFTTDDLRPRGRVNMGKYLAPYGISVYP